MDDNDKYRDDFLIACENGDFETIKRIELSGIGGDFYCPVTGENGLHKCARNRDPESSSKIAEYIQKRGMFSYFASRQTKTCDYTPLMLATHLQNEHMVRTLLIKSQLDMMTSKEMCMSDTDIYPPSSTALHIAMLSENIQIINLLLSAGASFWIANQNGDTALELAQKAKNAREIMSIFYLPTKNYAYHLIHSGTFTEKKMQFLKMFLNNGLDIDQTGSNGYTLLYTATHKAHLDCVRFLMSKGANINKRVSPSDSRYEYKKAPIHAAVSITNLDITKLLLEAKADVNLQVSTKSGPSSPSLQNTSS